VRARGAQVGRRGGGAIRGTRAACGGRAKPSARGMSASSSAATLRRRPAGMV